MKTEQVNQLASEISNRSSALAREKMLLCLTLWCLIAMIPVAVTG